MTKMCNRCGAKFEDPVDNDCRACYRMHTLFPVIVYDSATSFSEAEIKQAEGRFHRAKSEMPSYQEFVRRYVFTPHTSTIKKIGGK